MELKVLCDEIRKSGSIFSQQLLESRTLACVDGRFSQFLGYPLLEEGRLISTSDPQARPEVLQALREGCALIYRHCGGWQHALQKPFGYAGDFALLEGVCDQNIHPKTKTAVARLIDLWVSSTTLPRSVRGRKDTLRVFIEDFLRDYQTRGDKARVLSLASGAAREIREIDQELLQHLDLTLLDLDSRALEFAKRSMQMMPDAVQVTYLRENIFRVDAETLFSDQAPFDLIYSFGLFDYLKDADLIQCIQNFKRYLKPEAYFVFCLKDNRYYDAWFYDWSMDWQFVARTSADGQRLAQASGLEIVDTYRVEGNAIEIYICRQV